MPTAGDEGYETLVICPYDKSHEIRKGRMQFHLDKCRKNFPEKSKEMVQCPFNSVHLIPRYEENYHTQEECANRANFDRYTHQIGDITCPVKDLVPVNSYSSSVDAEENWDNFEAQGSVLNIIKQNAVEKPILRMMQCESRAKRKNFRLEERKRYNELLSKKGKEVTEPTHLGEEPLKRPTVVPTFKINKQDPKMAEAAISSCFKSMELVKNPSEAASSLSALPQREVMSPFSTKPSSLAYQDEHPMSYASSSSSRPGSALSYNTALGSLSEPHPSENSYASRPTSSMSSFPSLGSRPASALSKNRHFIPTPADGFCQVPIPGLGRGSRRKGQN